MREQHKAQIGALREAMAERKDAAKASHLKIAPFEEKEDIQDFLDAFEGIMTIQEVGKAEWVLWLTPLLSGKARTVCTKLGPTVEYDGVKAAILEQYNVNEERCRRRFCGITWTWDQEPMTWITNGLKLLNRWLTADDGIDAIKDKIAVEQFINALPQGLRVWVASHDPKKPAEIARLIETYDSAHAIGQVEREQVR